VTVLAVTAFAAGTGFGLAIARPSSAKLSPSPGVPAAATAAASSAPPGSQPASDGQDPVVAGCTGDAQVLGRVDVIHERAQIGIVELKFSRTCGAGWARLYLVEGAPAMFATVQIAAGDGTATSLTMFVKDAGPAGAIYTNVLTAHGGCLSASAILEPVVPQHVSAATPCTPPPR
jgi:hypothetical protein